MTRTNNRAQANWPNNAVSVLDFGAVGDGTTDDTAAIQAAFDYGFANGNTVILPSGTYITSKALKVYGGNSTGADELPGLNIQGDSKGGSLILKTSHTPLGNGSAHDVNAIMIVCNSSWRTGTINTTDRIRNIKLSDFSLRGGGDTLPDYGIYTADGTFTNSRLESLTVGDFNESGIQFNSPSNTNYYQSIRIYGGGIGKYGFNFASGNMTSSTLSQTYVLATTEVAYNMRGGYCTMLCPAADSCRKYVYSFTRFNGTIISPGSESGSAYAQMQFNDKSTLTITDARIYGNDNTTDSSGTTRTAATVLVFTANNCKVRFMGGELGTRPTGNDALKGRLITNQGSAGNKLLFFYMDEIRACEKSNSGADVTIITHDWADSGGSVTPY